MTETFKFKAQIPALTGGREAIMLDAREAWSPPADMPQKARAKLAVNVILDVIKERLRAPLGALIDAHAQAVEDEYALMEGEAPADGDISQPALDWWTGLFEAEAASFEGEVVGMIGAAAVMNWVRTESAGSTLADLILAKPIEDNANALAACGVTPQDISELALMGQSEENPSASTAALSETASMQTANGSTAASGPNGLAAEGVHPASHDLKTDMRGDYGNGPTVAIGAAEQTKGGEESVPGHDRTTTVESAPGAPPPAASGGAPRRRSPRTESSSVTEAAQAALETLADMGVKDAEVATALGVSRSQVINYRKGTTRLAPSYGQMDALSSVFYSAIDRLTQARETLSSALSLQDLE